MADGSIIIETGIDSSGFDKGIKELIAAINSLSGQVKVLGEKIESSFSGICTVAKGAAGDVREIEKAEKGAAKEASTLEKAAEKAGKSTSKAFDDSAVANTAKEVAKAVKENMKNVVPDDSIAEYILGDNLSGRINAAFASAKQGVSGFVQSLTAAKDEENGITNSAEILKQSLAALGNAPTFGSLTKDLLSVSTSLSQLEGLSRKAAGGSASAMERFDTKADQTREKIDTMERALEQLGAQKIPTEGYTAIQNEIEKADSNLRKLLNHKEQLEERGVDKSSKSWKNLQTDIDSANEKLKHYENAASSMEANGTAYTQGTDTQEYSNLASGISAAKERLAELEYEVNKAPSFGASIKDGLANGLRNVADAAKNAAKNLKSMLANGVKSGIKKLGSSITNVAKSMLGLNKSSKKSSVSLKKALNTVLRYGFGIRSLYFLFRRLRSAISEAFENLGDYSGEVNSALTSMSNALAVAKNSLATAFAPVVTAVAPYVTYLINLLTDALNVIGQFFAALFGATSYTKVASAIGDYTSATEDATDASEDAAEAAENQLASFDKLNVLSDTSSDSSGSSTGSDSDSGVTYETVSIDSAISDWIQALKDAWNSEDFTEVGALIAEKVNEAFEYAYELITWDNVGDTITYWVDAICEAFNSMVDNIDWDLIGRTFGTGINTIIYTIDTLLTDIDWENLGASIADALDGLIDEIDWVSLGKTLSDAVSSWLSYMIGAVQSFDWSNFGESIKDAIEGVDWTGIANKVFTLFGSALGGLAAFLGGLLSDGFNNAYDYFADAIEEMGGNIWDGIALGIERAITNIWKWIYTNILMPFINGFKSVFGISSPSTVMMEYGEYIVDGLLEGILDGVGNIAKWIKKNILSPIEDALGDFSGTIQIGLEKASGLWDSSVETILNLASTIKKTVTGILSKGSWNTVVDTVLNLGNTIKKTVTGVLSKSTWNTAVDTVLNLANSITKTVTGKLVKGSWSTAVNTILSLSNSITKTVTAKLVKGSWNSVANTALTMASSVTKTISLKITAITSSLTSAIKTLLGMASGGVITVGGKVMSFASGGSISRVRATWWDSVQKYAGGTSSAHGTVFVAGEAGPEIVGHVGGRTEVLNKSQLAETMYTAVVNGIGDAINAFWAALSEKMAECANAVISSMEYLITQVPTTDTSELLAAVQSIANSVSYAEPIMATGTITPYATNQAASVEEIQAAFDASNEGVINAIGLNAGTMTSAIVAAINALDFDVTIDWDYATEQVISGINKRTRMSGTSPLVGVS